MTTTLPTAAILLAAGAGTRLGRGPKALLPYGPRGGRPLIEQLTAVLLDAGCDRVVVVLGAEADRVRAEARLDGDARVTTVVNDSWATGMASSFRAGVAAALDTDGTREPTARVVVAHVDQPGVRPGDVALLLAEHRPGRVTASAWTGATVDGSLPRWSHPLVLAPGLARLAAASAAGDSGARSFLRAHTDLIDVVTHPGDGRDVDTPADLDLLT
ncbi:NTP transferase domain-containing protein [Isoptericola sp. BMS4]|uniref:nucleotidyltransferase family protein n=1 Tax=Isoptericola sp. BMS4 TaxID=2527875 RepID=UPI001F114797|nr:NTP transferase domain-containing protein [Isoptericola sp. BMS4]